MVTLLRWCLCRNIRFVFSFCFQWLKITLVWFCIFPDYFFFCSSFFNIFTLIVHWYECGYIPKTREPLLLSVSDICVSSCLGSAYPSVLYCSPLFGSLLFLFSLYMLLWFKGEEYFSNKWAYWPSSTSRADNCLAKFNYSSTILSVTFLAYLAISKMKKVIHACYR